MGNTVAEPATESDTEPELAPNLERSPEIPYCISPTPPAGENVIVLTKHGSSAQQEYMGVGAQSTVVAFPTKSQSVHWPS